MAWELLAREWLSAGAVVEHGVVTLVGRRCQRDGFAVSLEVLDSHTKARPHPGRAFFVSARFVGKTRRPVFRVIIKRGSVHARPNFPELSRKKPRSAPRKAELRGCGHGNRSRERRKRLAWRQSELFAFGVANSRLFSFGVPREAEFLRIFPQQTRKAMNLPEHMPTS
jgi:hypothetical protein